MGTIRVSDDAKAELMAAVARIRGRTHGFFQEEADEALRLHAKRLLGGVKP